MNASPQNPIFGHRFFGGLEADARRHVNPDGSMGAIVAVSATIADGLTLLASIEIGPFASIGPHASIGHGVSIGADTSIGHGVSIGADTSIGHGVSIGNGASIGADTSIGHGVSISYGDWFISCGPQGSRNAMLTAVQTVGGLRWWVGCKHNITTEALRGMVEKTHGGTDHEADYHHVIAFVENHPARIRCERLRAEKTEVVQ
mgnify:CR=1 FL=1